MATSDFAQKLLHDLRLRKQRKANTQNSDMYHNSKQNLKGSKETKTLEVSRKAGSRDGSSSNSQKAPANLQRTTQIVPYGGGHHSGQVNDLSMALAYAFDNRGKLKRLDIASNGTMMNLLQQIGRTSTQQRFDIQWQSTNQFPNLTNLHINEISKGAQKLNQLLRACPSGDFNINKGSIEIGKELWKGAMELEQSLRMFVNLQEKSSDNMAHPQRKSRLRLLDDNGDSEDDSTESSEKQKQVERPVFSFDKPSKNNKVTVQKLTVNSHLDDPNTEPERHMSLTTSNPQRHFASIGAEFNTSKLTSSSTSKHNAARLPNVIAKLMGIEELPQNSNPNVAAESSTSQQRSRDSVSSHYAQKSSKKADLKIEYTRPAKNTVNQIRVQSNKITVLTSQKIELQTKSLNLKQDGKTQNDGRKEANVKSMKQKREAATERSLGIPTPGIRSLNKADTLNDSDNQEKQQEKTRNLQSPQQKQYRDIELQKINMSHQLQGKRPKAENRSQPKTNHRNERKKRERNAEKMPSSRITATDAKNLQRQLPGRQANLGMKSTEDTKFAVSKTSSNNEQNEDPAEDVYMKSNDGRKSESKMTEVRPTTYMEATSVQKELSDTKPTKIRPSMKGKKEITKAVITPTTTLRALKPHKSTSETLKQNQHDKISVSREAPLANESTPREEPNNLPSCKESQQNEDAYQINSRSHTVQDKLLLQRTEVINITPGDGGKENISNIYDDHQEIVIDEVRVKQEVSSTDGQEGWKVNFCHQQKKQKPIKMEKQKPLTEEEMFLKQKLILSNLFLNTAEALFKLNIPISILNYASDQICESRDCKIILDCGYELLKRKGRRKEANIYPRINISMSYTRIKSLDDLVRQLHKDIEVLRYYGRCEKDAYDYASCILKMLKSDIYNMHPDLNSMWDLGWNEEMVPCVNMDEVICNIEQLMLDELMDEFTNDYLQII